MTSAAAATLAERHLQQGEPILARDAAQSGLALWPQQRRQRQLQALARSSGADQARATISHAPRCLREIERRNVDDQGQRLPLAQALHANTLGEPARAQAALDEAQRSAR